MPEPFEGTFWTLRIVPAPGDSRYTLRIDQRVLARTRREAVDFAIKNIAGPSIVRKAKGKRAEIMRRLKQLGVFPIKVHMQIETEEGC